MAAFLVNAARIATASPAVGGKDCSTPEGGKLCLSPAGSQNKKQGFLAYKWNVFPIAKDSLPNEADTFSLKGVLKLYLQTNEPVPSGINSGEDNTSAYTVVFTFLHWIPEFSSSSSKKKGHFFLHTFSFPGLKHLSTINLNVK